MKGTKPEYALGMCMVMAFSISFLFPFLLRFRRFHRDRGTWLSFKIDRFAIRLFERNWFFLQEVRRKKLHIRVPNHDNR